MIRHKSLPCGPETRYHEDCKQSLAAKLDLGNPAVATIVKCSLGAEGKKRMKALGRVEVPQEAFMAVLNLVGDCRLWMLIASGATE
eukprot:632684-Pelagomonas_calceolata.AAC.9